MSHYADNSFLVSCYLTDANTPQANPARCLRAAEFISFDSRQRALAAAVGLKVAP